MKAALIQSPNNLVLCDMPKPILQDGEALIKVRYIGVCGSDIHVLHGHHPTAVFPLVPGHEFVGKLVEAKGKGADRFQPGEMVVAQEVISCGSCDPCAKGEDNVCRQLQLVGIHTHGGFAEYVKVQTNKMYKAPAGVDLTIAALTEPLAVAVHDVRMSGLKVGELAFVVGGGPIGLLVAIVARASGARKVVVAEVNDYRRNFAKEMGFIAVNPLDGDYSAQLAGIHDGRGFDASFEAAGVNSALDACVEHTKPTGTVVIIAMTTEKPTLDTGKVFFKELRLQGVRVHSLYNFLGAVDLIESKLIQKDLEKLVSKVYPLDAVLEAFECAEKDKECFKILVEVK